MTIARILANKGRLVVTAQSERTLQEISAELILHAVGALVVVDANEDIVGLVSERDVVAAIASRGPDVLYDTVAQRMTTNPIVAAEDDNVDSTMETMTRERRRHLPVVHNGRLVGIVSIGDVVKYRIDAIEYERKSLHDYITKA